MIGRVVHAVRRLRGRSVAELRVRGSQATTAMLERAGLADGRPDRARRAPRLREGEPTDPALLLERFRARVASEHGPGRFFASLADPEGTLRALRARAPGAESAVLARAARVHAGRFDLLGYEGLSYGQPIDWHRDPVHGRSAPLAHWSRVPYLELATVGDHKVTWEINRHQHFVTLGQAYWLTGDESHARLVVDHLRAWADANPPKLGINWASSLEVAYRAISWAWALGLLARSPSLTPALFQQVLGLLDLHGRHVERYLSTYFSPNTHLTGEALGLFYLGTLFPELRAADRWRRAGREILLGELPRQVRPDGVYFEQASQYHRYTVEIFLHFALLAERNGDTAAAAAARPVVGRLFDHLAALTQPDGTIPLVGDDDGGRLVQLDGRPARDVRGLLAIGAAYLGRSDLAWMAGDEVAPTGWLLGADGLERLAAAGARAPAWTSRAFADGGYYVMRDGWGDDAAMALVDCGPHGTMNCGHAHADALAMTVAVGRPLLVDSGTFAYLGEARNEFRATHAHNTVVVDGESSSVPTGPFSWAGIARCEPTAWVASDRFDWLAGTHDGYGRLASPATHERAVLFVKGGVGGTPFWVVRDRIRSEGSHDVAVSWHAAPGYALTLPAEAGGVEAMLAHPGDAEAPGLRLAAFGPGRWEARRGWVSLAYGGREEAPVAVYAQAGAGHQEVVTFLMPQRAGRAAPAVRRVECAGEGGACFVVSLDGGPELLVVLGRGRTAVATDAGGGVETDAECAVVRLDPAGASPQRDAARDAVVAMVGGSYLRRDGIELHRS